MKIRFSEILDNFYGIPLFFAKNNSKNDFLFKRPPKLTGAVNKKV
jgi:hypothetical protein